MILGLPLGSLYLSMLVDLCNKISHVLAKQGHVRLARKTADADADINLL